MAESEVNPWGEPPSKTEPKACVLCDKPTKSHAIAVSEGEQGFEAADPDYCDMIFPVCHSCYRDIDGSAEQCVGRLNAQTGVAQAHDSNITATAFQDALRKAEQEVGKSKKAVVGEESCLDYAKTELEPGDLVKVNDTDTSWAIVPRDEDRIQRLDNSEQVIHPVVEMSMDDKGRAGGLVVPSSEDSMWLYHTRADTEELSMESVEKVDLAGHSEEVADIDL